MALGVNMQQPQAYKIGDVELKCLVCAHEFFWHREVRLTEGVLTFDYPAWKNRYALCLVCEKCGYIHWFLPQ
jgi:predicted nucleic-acid-binding Zn-ribbon protein